MPISEGGLLERIVKEMKRTTLGSSGAEGGKQRKGAVRGECCGPDYRSDISCESCSQFDSRTPPYTHL